MTAEFQLALDLPSPSALPSPVDRAIALGGSNHYREQIRANGAAWPHLVRGWQAWLLYFERMHSHGFTSAQSVKPVSFS